jgi:hypothetical protein
LISKKTTLLLCFVALVGAVGAYAYMLNNRSSVELVRMDVSNGLVLEVDKTVYELGENVTITFTNNSTETVAFPTSAWFNIRDSDGNLVAPGGWTHAVLTVPAGYSLTWVWDQLDYVKVSIAPPGIYMVEVTVYTAALVAITDLSVTFEIVD